MCSLALVGPLAAVAGPHACVKPMDLLYYSYCVLDLLLGASVCVCVDVCVCVCVQYAL